MSDVTATESQVEPAADVAESRVESVHRIARRTFVSGQKIEMGGLAVAAGVSRATLFRWVGSRDRLLGEVIWRLTEPTIETAVAGARGTGASRIAQIMGDFAATANDAGYFGEFLRREPERALRVMTTRAGGVQHRIVAKIEELLAGEVAAGTLEPPLPVHDLAFLLVRITETFVYTNIISGERPDAAKVVQASAALLGGRA